MKGKANLSKFVKIMDKEFEIAFSFLTRDEPLAVRLNNHFKERYNTFIYLDVQDQLAGVNAIEKFTSIFKNQSRVVVVLFRKGWGEDGMTRIEKSALEQRMPSEGLDYILMVLLDENDRKHIPIWYPPTYIWYGLEKYGDIALISAIEHKIVQMGGREVPLTQ